ncbi:hemerythrin family protein [uncultured Amphritea sp.]|uniref:bacteriohemerythrin n=1 Tax=uncultured Amphritea sp. TaxID=981605 RepID=UPI00261BE30F|nr:hemerythrin family protein [uncultured Amphritea sp.]
MPVIWRSQISTGNDLIDLDHKYLIALFNSVELAISKPENLKYLPIFFRELVDYTREHFSREEKIQIKIRYPYYAEHKQEHQQIVEHLEQLYRKILEVVGGGDTPISIDEFNKHLNTDIINLAREWVIDHLIKTDGKMAVFLRKHPQDLS